jgi:SAM-dependent methyltransferase
VSSIPGIDWYAERHVHFLDDALPPLLARTARRGTIVDLGCGDGATLFALGRAGLLESGYGIDLSDLRVRRVSQLPGVTGVVADAASVPLPEASADGVVCSQVIEHVESERAVVGEIARLLRPGGWWYVGSVLRGPRAWWIYKRDGRRWLDPTHVREYPTVDAFAEAVRHESLEVTAVDSKPLRYPVSDLVLRALRRDGQFYARHPWLVRVRKVRMRVPGYRLVEAAGVKPAVSDASHTDSHAS